VELGFAVISNKGITPSEYRFPLFREAFTTATPLDRFIAVDLNGNRTTRYEHFHGMNPPWTKFVKVWDEARTVKTKTDATPKLNDRARCAMYDCGIC
jgi:hypothetical protein